MCWLWDLKRLLFRMSWPEIKKTQVKSFYMSLALQIMLCLFCLFVCFFKKKFFKKSLLSVSTGISISHFRLIFVKSNFFSKDTSDSKWDIVPVSGRKKKKVEHILFQCSITTVCELSDNIGFVLSACSSTLEYKTFSVAMWQYFIYNYISPHIDWTWKVFMCM